MEEIDRNVFNVSALVVVSDNHADIFVSGHALRLVYGYVLAGKNVSGGAGSPVVAGLLHI